MPFRSDCHIFNVQNHFPRLRRLLLHNEIDITPYHHSGKFFGSRIFHIYGSYILSFSQYAATIGHFHDFRQFVRDKKNTFTLCRQIFHDHHQLVDLLGRQHCRRFVKNQNLIVPIEHLQYFRPLLHPHRNILDQRVWIYQETVFFGQINHFLFRLVFLKQSPFGRFHA